jgi:hypothetical protein
MIHPACQLPREDRTAAAICLLTAGAASVQKCTAIMEKYRSAMVWRTGGGREKSTCRIVPARHARIRR